VAIYQSVRYRTSANGDPTSIGGSAGDIADELVAIVTAHRPSVVGMALVVGLSPITMVRDVAPVPKMLREGLVNRT
jgi:hypothetical protein